MGAASLEIVLTRQLASYLAVPILVVDAQGDLVFFNESAEPILGSRFDETGSIRRGEWSALFEPTDERGLPIPRDEQPLSIATDRRRPAYRSFGLTGLDGRSREVEGIAVPLETAGNGLVGAVGIFWESRARTQAPVPTTPPRRPAGRSRSDVEVILLRRLADRLPIPIVTVEPGGQLAHCNAAAEPLLGRQLAQIQGLSLPDWYEAFHPTGEDGSLIKREDHPLNVARTRLRPCHRRMSYRSLDGTTRCIEGTAFPLLGQCDRHLGAVGIFWEQAR